MKRKSNIVYITTITFFKVVFKVFFRGKVVGLENVPKEGGLILASNHVSHLDPPFIAASANRHPVFSLARKTLFKKGIVNWFYKRLNMIPLDRERGSDLKALKTVFKRLEEGNILSLFPEGTRSLNGQPQSPKKGIGMIAHRSKAPVVPVRIFGSFEALQKGSKKPNWGQKITIVFGKPLHSKEFEDCLKKEDRYQEISNRIMQAICSIQNPFEKDKEAQEAVGEKQNSCTE